MNKIKSVFMGIYAAVAAKLQSRSVQAAAALLVGSGSVLVPTVAFAQTTQNPTNDVTTLMGSATSGLYPVLIALGTAAITLAVLAYGIRKVFRFLHSGGHSVV